MLTLFRKIRLRLLRQAMTGTDKNSHFNSSLVRRYLLYAIGEIALVVIGILIALQINNWNENKKNQKEVRNLLIALKSDLVQDTSLILERLPFILEQQELNESLRARVAAPGTTLDTLIHIMRHEFNPNWTVQVTYNTNAYNSLNETRLIEFLPGSLQGEIKNFYNRKFTLQSRIDQTTDDYRGKITSYVDTYTFGSTAIHDQGPLIDGLVWSDINPAHLAASFQGLSNFKRILFNETKQELDYSLANSLSVIKRIDEYLLDGK